MTNKQNRSGHNLFYFAFIKRHHLVRLVRAERETLMEDLMAGPRQTPMAITHCEVYSLLKSRKYIKVTYGHIWNNTEIQ